MDPSRQKWCAKITKPYFGWSIKFLYIARCDYKIGEVEVVVGFAVAFVS